MLEMNTKMFHDDGQCGDETNHDEALKAYKIAMIDSLLTNHGLCVQWFLFILIYIERPDGVIQEDHKYEEQEVGLVRYILFK